MIAFLLLICLSGFMLLVLDMLSYCVQRKGWQRFASTFLLFFGQIIATQFVLGFFSLLYGWIVALVSLALSLGLLYLLDRKFGRKKLHTYFSDFGKMVRNTAKTARSDPFWAILAVLAALVVGWIIFLGLLFPATDFDGNSYHLTFIGNVMQYHNFYDVSTSLPWLVGYPKGGEFMQLWAVLITNNDLLVDLVQVPFLFLGMYALYSISVALGAEKRNARFVALLFLFMPMVMAQLKTTYVDVMLCALFFAGLAMVIKHGLRKLDYLLIGIIFSLIIAVKSTGVLFVAVLLPLLLWNMYRSYGKNLKTYLWPLVLMAGPLTFGLYWYIKNLVVYGTPIYPFGFKIAGFSLFPGKTFQEFGADAITSTSLPAGGIERIWYVWTEQNDWFGCLYNYDTNYAGLGPLWFIILIPAFLVSCYLAFKKKNWLFFGVAGTIALLFLLYPANYYARYTMFVTALGIIGLSLVLGNLSKVGAWVAKAMVVLLSIFVILTSFTLCNFPPGAVKDQWDSLRAGSSRGMVYNNMPVKAFVFMQDRVESGEVVAYSSSPYFIYPLWKPDFSNKVIFVTGSDEQNWLQEVRDERVKYYFATVGSKEHQWAENNLTSLYKDEMYEAYEVY